MENTTITPKERLSRVLGLAGALFEEHRHRFVFSHLDEVAAIQRSLENLLHTVASERREYESWLDELKGYQS